MPPCVQYKYKDSILHQFNPLQSSIGDDNKIQKETDLRYQSSLYCLRDLH